MRDDVENNGMKLKEDGQGGGGGKRGKTEGMAESWYQLWTKIGRRTTIDQRRPPRPALMLTARGRPFAFGGKPWPKALRFQTRRRRRRRPTFPQRCLSVSLTSPRLGSALPSSHSVPSLSNGTEKILLDLIGNGRLLQPGPSFDSTYYSTRSQ